MSRGRTTATASIGRWTLATAAVLVLGFLMAPLIIIVAFSFNGAGDFVFPISSWSLRWYVDFFTSEVWLSALGNSLVLAIATTLIATPLGTLAALGLTTPNLPGARFISALFLIPMIAPVVIIGVGMYFVFSASGLASTYVGLVAAHTALAVPFVVISVSAVLVGLDRRLLWAAASMGATPFHAFRKVTLPAIVPGVASGGLFAFATSLDEVVVTLFLAGPGQRTLPREMFTTARDTLKPTIAAAATVLIIASVLLLAASALLGKGRERPSN